jgi:hypothetical protein
MDEHIANREMLMAGAFIALTICALVWQVLRTLSRGALDATSVVRLVCSVFMLGIMLYVGHTMLSMWT